MLYTFSIEQDFIDFFKNKLDVKEARIVNNFIKTNFINKSNFFFKANRKKFFKQDLNCANVSQLKILLDGLNRKIKKFPEHLNADFILSNNLVNEKNIISTNKIIDETYIDIEEELEQNFKPYWSYVSSESNQNNKRNLANSLKKVVSLCDEIYLVDRHIPRTLCELEVAKKKYPEEKKKLEDKLNNKSLNLKDFNYKLNKLIKQIKSAEKYHLSYNNSFEYLNNILKENNSKNRFYCGMLKKDLEELKIFDDGEIYSNDSFISKEKRLKKSAESILKKSFKKFSDSTIIVHVKSDYTAYKNKTSYRRYIIGLINGSAITMIRTDSGLNLLNDEFELQRDEFAVNDPNLTLHDWHTWKVEVDGAPDLIKFVA